LKYSIPQVDLVRQSIVSNSSQAKVSNDHQSVVLTVYLISDDDDVHGRCH